MSVKFKSFSSGSCGNCYFLGLFSEESRRSEAGVIIDAGVSPRRLKKELQADGLCFDDFSAVLVTHDHQDHIRSLGSFCKHIGKPVWATDNLHRALCRHNMTKYQINDYRMTISGYNITNTHEIETVDIEGEKTWDDGDDQDKRRPERITIVLWADGVRKDTRTVTADSADKDGRWTYSFEDLPKSDADGNEIESPRTPCPDTRR